MSVAPAYWQSIGARALLLWPVSLLFGTLARGRQWCYRLGFCKVIQSEIPVIVVGNISVGGTGKTPLTQALVGSATEQSMRCGIVIRGHGGQVQSTPFLIDNTTTAAMVGDEPLLHHHKTGVPVVVCTDRAAAVQKLSDCDVNLAFSDDGLQHYKMQRACEIAVVDGDAGFANAMLLPSGPLREPIKRLTTVDIVAVQITAADAHPDTAVLLQDVPQLRIATDAGVPVGSFFLKPVKLRQLWTDKLLPLDALHGKAVTAVAGIGAPERFFQALRSANLTIQPVSFDDHHEYSEEDLQSLPAGPVVVTGKDAVKIKALSLHSLDIYVLEIDIDMSENLELAVHDMFKKLNAHPKAKL
ncbi:MAG: tetraacyldisaccharide 4'-kinase [Granulosicoccaceae bacterium]